MMEKFKRFLFYLIATITIFRLVYINFVPLVPQEAYYWKYAKNLALSYFDHPPMTAYIIAFFTWIGGDHVFFIRLGSILISIGLMVLIYSMLTRLFGNQRWGIQTLLAINCTVLFSIGSTVITPDVPLLFFWALIVYSLVRLQETDHWKWWYLAGMALGFGILSKYTAVLIVPGILIYMILSKSQRKWFFTIHPYFALMISLFIFTPVILWNYQHDWASFFFQSSNRFSKMIRFRSDFFFQLIGSQLGMLTPYVFLLIFIGWLRIGILSLKEHNEKYSLLFWMAFPTYFVFILSSFRSLVKMNWLAPAYITSLIAAIVWMNSSGTKWSNRFKKWFKPGLIIGLVIVLFMHLLPLVPIFPMRRGDTWTGWQQLANRVLEIKNGMGKDTFIFGNEYKVPSEITFYTLNHEMTHSGEIIGEKGLQYDYWTNIGELINKNAIFVTSDFERYRNIDNLKKHFKSVEEEPPLKIIHHNKVFRVFYLYRCYGYKGTTP